MNQEILHTSLFNFHQACGAKLVPFAGYAMPVQYPLGIAAEHNFVRSKAGIFDVSHMGQFSIKGDETVCKQLEQIVPLDLASLRLNQSKYSFLINDKGGINDDLIVTKVKDGINIVLNAACKHNDVLQIKSVFKKPAKFMLHDELSLIAIQGPMAVSILESFIPGVSNLKFMNGGSFVFKGQPAYVTRSGYTGEDGFEVSIVNASAKDLCETLLNNSNITMIGLGARDSLRLEAGLCLYGHDLNSDITPIEADLLFGIAKQRRETCDFIGGSIVKNHLLNGIKKKRVGIQPKVKIIAREHTKVFHEGKEVGEITSGGFGPSVGFAVAMGYVNIECSEVGTSLQLEVRGKQYPAKVCLLPFYKKSYAK
ncbi:MAG: glycine cleavage system protein T [alpha proteobacterium QL1]|jgi:glycine cleavage system T protein|nr:MAG: glycine cleavage system protein T [alpha proteobacterium QL1]